MHALLLLIMICCGPVGLVTAYARVSRGFFSTRPSRNGHIAPVCMAIFSLFAAMVYHVIWLTSADRARFDLIAAGLAAFCVAGTLLLLFYDPAKPRDQIPAAKKA